MLNNLPIKNSAMASFNLSTFAPWVKIVFTSFSLFLRICQDFCSLNHKFTFAQIASFLVSCFFNVSFFPGNKAFGVFRANKFINDFLKLTDFSFFVCFSFIK